ncbi:hypothetical protein [Virgisporangium aliadipatigenens]|uniref:hypothetical protein n=1 Tax=Virgisporangium aliadipatigenens TaxID=741659 RepID=UPI0019453715|nr:hypothetical protein [Virgisporangium aliadipatigenens]
MRLLVILLVGALVPVVPGTAHAATPAADVRGMWLWTRPSAVDAVAFAAQRRVKEIFVHVPTSPDVPYLRELRQRASAAGIKLAALGGETSWTTDHAAALAWQRAALGTGLFDAVHVDVEPYLLPEWQTAQATLAQQYLNLLGKLAAATTKRVEADVPFWLGQLTVGRKNLATEVLSRVDAITVMSYRNTVTGPNSVMDIGRDFLTRAAAARKPARLAVETQPLAECAHCTFSGMSAATLDRALTSIDTTGNATSTGYAGVAVHHYDSWRSLA